MGDILGEVDRWRIKAEELFAAANNMRNQAARDQMLQMAEGYNRLADRMEDLAVKQLAARGNRPPLEGL